MDSPSLAQLIEAFEQLLREKVEAREMTPGAAEEVKASAAALMTRHEVELVEGWRSGCAKAAAELEKEMNAVIGPAMRRIELAGAEAEVRAKELAQKAARRFDKESIDGAAGAEN
jgi:hypothetical protein